MSRDQLLGYYLSLQEYYHFPLTDKRDIVDQELIDMRECLDRFFSLSMLQFQIELSAYHMVINKTIKNSIYYDEVPTFVKSLKRNERKLYDLCQMLIDLHEETDNKRLNKAWQTYKIEYLNFEGFDNKFILQTFANLKTRLFKMENAETITELFEIYKFGVEKGILFYDDSTSVAGFLNIVNVAARTKNLAWADNFIRNHWEYLPNTNRESIKKLATSLIDFEKGKFKKIIKALNVVQFNIQSISYRHRLLLAKCHIELLLVKKADQDEAINQLNAFEKYARRQKAKSGKSSRSVDLYINFIKISRRIISSTKKGRTDAAAKIRIRLEAFPSIAARYWLLQKLAAMEQPIES